MTIFLPCSTIHVKCVNKFYCRRWAKLSQSKPNSNGAKRKQGETSRKIIFLLIDKPGISISEIADTLDSGYENIRVAIKKMRENPQYYAARLGFDEETVLRAILSVVTRLQKSTRPKRNSPYSRGKGNWPAWKAATKKSLTDEELVRACWQHYEYHNGRYNLNEDEIEKATVKIGRFTEDGFQIERAQKGRPSIPTSFSFS